MKYAVVSFFRRVIASILAFFTGLFSPSAPTPETVRPDANTVTAYSEEAADYALRLDAGEEIRDISDLLFGIFFEDINFSADGGLYAEMVANRSFEFTSLAAGDQLYHYGAVNGAALDVKIGDAQNALNRNNTNYLVLTNPADALAGVKNIGFMEGMCIEEKGYDFSVYAKADAYSGPVTVRLMAGDTVAAEGVIPEITNEWTKYELRLNSAVKADTDVSLQVLIGRGSVCLDMISLFPEDTYKGRENGLRKDLAEALEALQPKFLRFPGGCVIEGYNIPTAYRWKDSVGQDENGAPLLFNGRYGDVAARTQGENIWTDHSAAEDPWPCFMTYGLGFYEYFQLAEDIGAVGVPVLNCGLYCQMRGMHGEDMASADFAMFKQDMLDLVDFCRGDETTPWGKARIEMGHPEPFELPFIAIGNENEGEEYFERYQAFVDAFNEAKAENPDRYDGIALIYSAGASDALNGGNHKKAYEYAAAQLGDAENTLAFAGAIDEHYYQSPEWFLQNGDYYDETNYRRAVTEMTDTVYGGAIPVFLGEYAARSNTVRAALAEAAYMTGLERNGDIVRMAAYAPLFASNTASHWRPNLIWFDNDCVTPSVNYYAQKLFANNQGSVLLESSLAGAAVPQPPLKGRVGVGTWYTEAAFDHLKVVDNDTGKTLLSDAFTLPDFRWNWQNPNDGKFKIKNGRLLHEGTGMNYSDIGDVAYYGTDNEMTNYTYTIEAEKLAGEEGFLIPFAVQSETDNWFWNIGGWQNTVSCLQRVTPEGKTGQLLKTAKPFTVETGRVYELKVTVRGTQVQCFIDGELMVDYDTGFPAEAEAYQVVSTDETGDLIVKLVNVTDFARTFAVKAENAAPFTSAAVQQLAGESPDFENAFGDPAQNIGIEAFTLSGLSSAFNYTVPACSVTVLRIPQK
jgi:alpha-L-arabinofuranosidase